MPSARAVRVEARWLLPSAVAMALASVVAGRVAEDAWSSAVVVADDECGLEGDTDCAIHALQRRQQKDSVIANTLPFGHAATNASGSSRAQDDCFSRAYKGEMQGSSLCFCQLAGNPACVDTGCACPQGCGNDIAFRTGATVSFKNKAQAEGCPDNTVLLTSPKSYFQDPAELRTAASGSCAVGVITQLLEASWDRYQNSVLKGTVWQCVHGSAIASVKYLHLQTFCRQGNFHGMPTDEHRVASCVEMKGKEEAAQLASKLEAMIAQE